MICQQSSTQQERVGGVVSDKLTSHKPMTTGMSYEPIAACAVPKYVHVVDMSLELIREAM